MIFKSRKNNFVSSEDFLCFLQFLTQPTQTTAFSPEMHSLSKIPIILVGDYGDQSELHVGLYDSSLCSSNDLEVGSSVACSLQFNCLPY